MSEEFETVILKLPKGFFDLLRTLGEDPQDYFKHLILEGLRADFEELKHNPIVNQEALDKKFGITKILESRK